MDFDGASEDVAIHPAQLCLSNLLLNSRNGKVKQKRGVICGPDSANAASVSTCAPPI